jgi:hypothetical protein
MVHKAYELVSKKMGLPTSNLVAHGLLFKLIYRESFNKNYDNCMKHQTLVVLSVGVMWLDCKVDHLAPSSP